MRQGLSPGRAAAVLLPGLRRGCKAAEAARLYAEIPGVGCEHLTPENSVDCRAFRGRFMGGAYDFIAPPGFAEILLTFWNLHEIVIVCGIGISNACFLCIQRDLVRVHAIEGIHTVEVGGNELVIFIVGKYGLRAQCIDGLYNVSIAIIDIPGGIAVAVLDLHDAVCGIIGKELRIAAAVFHAGNPIQGVIGIGHGAGSMKLAFRQIVWEGAISAPSHTIHPVIFFSPSAV